MEAAGDGVIKCPTVVCERGSEQTKKKSNVQQNCDLAATRRLLYIVPTRNAIIKIAMRIGGRMPGATISAASDTFAGRDDFRSI
jgi:hypothetical protein